MNLGIPWAYWVSSALVSLLPHRRRLPTPPLTRQIQFILGGASVILNLFFLRETRADVILSRRARRLTRQTGRTHLCVADMQRQSLWTLMSVSVVRPLREWARVASHAD
jgi:hypothetical protein